MIRELFIHCFHLLLRYSEESSSLLEIEVMEETWAFC